MDTVGTQGHGGDTRRGTAGTQQGCGGGHGRDRVEGHGRWGTWHGCGRDTEGDVVGTRHRARVGGDMAWTRKGTQVETWGGDTTRTWHGHRGHTQTWQGGTQQVTGMGRSMATAAHTSGRTPGTPGEVEDTHHALGTPGEALDVPVVPTSPPQQPTSTSWPWSATSGTR